MQPAHSPFRFVAGALIAGKYRLVRPLGEGGMGVVWSAVNDVTGGQVALKLLVRPEPELRVRMLREARAVCAIRHRNVLQVHDVGQTDTGDPFLVMELLSGETLADLLARKRRLLPGEAAGIGRDVARALSAAHEQGILHRDLKPANIFLHEEPGTDGHVVKVVDFGVSKSLRAADDARTAPGGTLGSPRYMSPEQMQADPTIDGRTDIWSLGVVLYEMVTGEPPFRGEPLELVRMVLTEPAPRAARRLRKLDPRYDDLVAACLRRPREERPWPASELAARLGEIAGSEGAGAGGLSSPSAGSGAQQGGSTLGAPMGHRPPAPSAPEEDARSSPGASGEIGLYTAEGARVDPAKTEPRNSPLPGLPSVQDAPSTTMPIVVGGAEPREASAPDGGSTTGGIAHRSRPSRMPWVLGGVTAAVLVLAGVLVAVWPSGSEPPAVGGPAFPTSELGAGEPTKSAAPANASSPAPGVATTAGSSSPSGAVSTAVEAKPSDSGPAVAAAEPPVPSSVAPAVTPSGGAKAGSPGPAAGGAGRPAAGKTAKPPARDVCKCDVVPRPACCGKYAPDDL